MNIKHIELQFPDEEVVKNLLKERQISGNEIKSRVLLLKTWLDEQPHLPHYMEEKMIENFLFSCKCSLEVAKEKIDAYFTGRHQLPEIFTNRDPSSEKLLLLTKYARLFPLPQLTKEGYRVVYSSLIEDHEGIFNFTDCCKAVINLCDVLLRSESFPAGQHVIIDGRFATMSQALKIQPFVLSTTLYYFQKILPTQTKGIFVINATPITEFVSKIFMPFMSKKLQERIHIFNGDHSELYNFIDKKILPRDFGGEESSIEELSEAWQRIMEKHRDWLMQEGTQLSDESKRPEKEKWLKNNTTFGVSGSFRRLEID